LKRHGGECIKSKRCPKKRKRRGRKKNFLHYGKNQQAKWGNREPNVRRPRPVDCGQLMSPEGEREKVRKNSNGVNGFRKGWPKTRKIN